MSHRYLHLGLGAIVVALLDLATKWLAASKLTSSIVLIPHLLTLQLAHNPALAFGVPLPRIAIIALSLIAVGGIGYVFAKQTHDTRITTATFALILGGALGNLSERIVDGTVTDFIRLWVIPNFNIADVALTLGAAMLIFFHASIFRVNSRS